MTTTKGKNNQKTMSDIGVLGLGVMGKSLAKNLANKGLQVAVYNFPLKGEEQVVADFAAQNSTYNFFAAKDIPQFLQNLRSPRKVLLMVKSGAPVDVVIAQLQPHLKKGDILIDGGNSYYKDTIRREKELMSEGIFYVGMGVSGGEKGALLGPSMMPAGKLQIKPALLPIFKKIAATTESGAPCVDWIGTDGSGHFVKMVHNGIEYADMQILAETYGVLKVLFADNQTSMVDYLADWKKDLHDSYLLDITLQILQYKENGSDLLPQILDVAGHKGTGLWTVKEALDLGVPIPTIAAAMNARIVSSHKPLRQSLSTHSVMTKFSMEVSEKEALLKLLPDAILAARLIALAEGFHLLQTASTHYDWNLSLSNIAKIWREGCIIRSKMLPKIAAAFDESKEITHLFATPLFADLLAAKMIALQDLMTLLPRFNGSFPALSAALQYHRSMHEAYSSINMIQAQRDYFGAHGYRKLEVGSQRFHTEWD